MRPRYFPIVVALMALCVLTPAFAQKEHKTKVGVLWADPGDIRAKDLFYGPGGKDGQPKLPVHFKKEITHGNSPKFDVKDANGETWRVKLGPEAHAEPVASRLLWAVGYFTNTNYYVASLPVEQMIDLTRGGQDVHPRGVTEARLQQNLGHHEKSWSWRDNPFANTREFNGLRVMMALLHNWDLKDENNAKFKDKKTGHEIYYVSDVGASFGTTGKSYSEAMSKSNLDAYKSAKFIDKVTEKYVDFNFPTHPALYHLFNLPFFYHAMRNEWVGKKIPREDVRWIASLLSQLSRKQIEDAFRAGGYTPEQVEQYTAILQSRIEQLAKL